MVEFKVYRLNEYETVAAPSLEEAIKWYREEYGSDEEIDDPYEVEHNARMWDDTGLLGKELDKLRDRVWTEMEESCDDGVRIDGKFYTIIFGDLLVETTYGERLKRLNPTEPMVFSCSEV